MKRALTGGFAAIMLITGLAKSADEPSKKAPVTTKGAGIVESPGWNFKLTPNSGPVLTDPVSSANTPVPFAIGVNTKLQRKGQGEPTLIELPRYWWTGDYLTPLEKSRRVIPRSDRVRD